jgi:DNA-binding NarL/FixJ family response regulator
LQSTMKLLKTYIVEDSKIIRDSLIAALEEMAPIQVVGFAEDEPAAVQWLGAADNAADLVIVDIFLKLGSGLGVLTAARRLQLASTLVVLSNHATPDMRRKCTELGADKVYDKSNELDALMLYCERLASNEAGNTVGGELS